MQYKGWEAEFSSAGEDLVIHLLDKPKSYLEGFDSNVSGDEAQSSNKETKKCLKADLNKWTTRQLSLAEEKNNA